MFAHEAPRLKKDSCSQCSLQQPTLYRCDDCFGEELLCSTCVVQNHGRHPFHQIKSWSTNSTTAFFLPFSLTKLGYILHTGHGGKPCPDYEIGRTSSLAVLDLTGIHNMQAAYCTCSQSVGARDLSLISCRLFPASTGNKVQTAVSFRLLRYFQELTLATKTSTQEFNQVLLRISNAEQDSTIKVWNESCCTLLFVAGFKQGF